MEPYSITLPESLLKAVDRVSKRRRSSRAEVVRTCIAIGLEIEKMGTPSEVTVSTNQRTKSLDIRTLYRDSKLKGGKRMRNFEKRTIGLDQLGQSLAANSSLPIVRHDSADSNFEIITEFGSIMIKGRVSSSEVFRCPHDGEHADAVAFKSINGDYWLVPTFEVNQYASVHSSKGLNQTTVPASKLWPANKNLSLESLVEALSQHRT